MHRALATLVLAGAMLAAGCDTYLQDDHSQAVSLQTYRSAVIEAIELSPEVSEQWIAETLRDSLQCELDSSPWWPPAGEAEGTRDLALRVMIDGAQAGQTRAKGRLCPSLTLSGRLEVFDRASGALLGSAPLEALYVDDGCDSNGCSLLPPKPDPEALHRGAVRELTDIIVRMVTSAKQSPQAWEHLNPTLGTG